MYSKKVARVYGEHYPENITISENFDSLSAELMQHLFDEENVVFPLISDIAAKRKKGENISIDQVRKLQEELNLLKDQTAASDSQSLRGKSHF